VARSLGGARVLLGGQATEASLKRARGPSVLHIATNAFFLADDTTGSAVHRGSAPDLGDKELGLPTNPLLRSGLAFAGANRLRSGADDGVLTALEASGLDLWGTKLAVLSACNTGVGEVRNGDGVYGMRRAFMAAGAESLVTSLWKVDDTATRELMAGYYRALLAGAGRGEALRRVQVEGLRSAQRSHPYYWAAFTLTGQWSPLAPALLSGGEPEQKGGARR
jgi:CHAT domain-containing protein